MFCSLCGTRNTTADPIICEDSIYCSVVCQRVSWRTGHRVFNHLVDAAIKCASVSCSRKMICPGAPIKTSNTGSSEMRETTNISPLHASKTANLDLVERSLGINDILSGRVVEFQERAKHLYESSLRTSDKIDVRESTEYAHCVQDEIRANIHNPAAQYIYRQIDVDTLIIWLSVAYSLGTNTGASLARVLTDLGGKDPAKNWYLSSSRPLGDSKTIAMMFGSEHMTYFLLHEMLWRMSALTANNYNVPPFVAAMGAMLRSGSTNQAMLLVKSLLEFQTRTNTSANALFRICFVACDLVCDEPHYFKTFIRFVHSVETERNLTNLYKYCVARILNRLTRSGQFSAATTFIKLCGRLFNDSIDTIFNPEESSTKDFISSLQRSAGRGVTVMMGQLITLEEFEISAPILARLLGNDIVSTIRQTIILRSSRLHEIENSLAHVYSMISTVLSPMEIGSSATTSLDANIGTDTEEILDHTIRLVCIGTTSQSSSDALKMLETLTDRVVDIKKFTKQLYGEYVHKTRLLARNICMLYHRRIDDPNLFESDNIVDSVPILALALLNESPYMLAKYLVAKFPPELPTDITALVKAMVRICFQYRLGNVSAIIQWIRPIDESTATELQQNVTQFSSSVIPLPPKGVNPRPATVPDIYDFGNAGGDDIFPSAYMGRIMETWFSREKAMALAPNWTDHQSDLNDKMFGVMTGWMMELANKFRLRIETLFTAVFILCRALADFQNIPRTELQLYAVAAMLIASKIEEIYAIEIGDLKRMCDNAYDNDEIRDCELSIIKRMQSDFFYPTSVLFLRIFAVSVTSIFKNHALSKILNYIPLYIYPSGILPSEFAAGSLYLAYQISHKSSDPPYIWVSTHDFRSVTVNRMIRSNFTRELIVNVLGKLQW